MKMVEVPTRAKSLNALLRQAQQDPLILRSADVREFILAEMDDFASEIELTRKNEKLMQLLDERAKQSKTINLEEVKAQLGLD